MSACHTGNTPPSRPAVLLTVLLGRLLALAGCGGGGASETASESGSTATAAVAGPWVGPPGTDTVPGTREVALAGTTPEPVPTADVPPADNSRAQIAQTTPGATLESSGETVEIFVALDGDDRWSGGLSRPNAARTDGPLRSLPAAQALARQRLAAMVGGAQRRPVQVRIAPGEYRLSETLFFGTSDSGVPGAPMVYRAETPGTVTLSGALRVATLTGLAAGRPMALPTAALDPATRRGGGQLYVNGRLATLARTPNAGQFWFVARALPLADEPATARGREAFAPPAEALAMMAGLPADDRAQAIVQIMQEWTSGWHRLSSQVAPAGGVRVTPRTHWPFLQGGLNQRFFVENVAAALDAPGEWLWDGAGLRYLATAADTGRELGFDVPRLERLIHVSGNAVTGAFVQDLEFRGLGFAYTRRLTPDAGYVDNQAVNAVGAAIEVDAARHIAIEDCTVTRTGGYAIWLRTAVRDSRVARCHLHETGAGGIKVGNTVVWPAGDANTGRNTLSANRIVDTGRLLPGAVGIWIGRSSDNTVANTTYSAISVGWKWTYGGSTASGNRITDNLLVNIGRGTLSDLGGIYTLGESPGTVLSGNVIHNVRAFPGYGAGAFGLYNDPGSSDIVSERNIVVGTDDGGYLLNQGRRNIVRNNVLAYGDKREVRLAINQPETNLDFSSNLLIPKVGVPFDALATAPDFRYTANRVSNRVLSGALDLSRCNGGCALSSALLAIGADPRAVSLGQADAATAAWVAAVAAAVGPPGLGTTQIPPVDAALPPPASAPPVNYEAEIADTAVGQRPFSMHYRTGDNAAAIAIEPSAGTPSGKCLRFADSPSMPNSWDPHAWATLNHTRGVSTVEFTIRIDAATDFMHEWRDRAQPPFLTGPAIRIRPGGIEAAAAVVAPAPVGQWITLRITAATEAAAGRWTLDVKQGSGSFVRTGEYANRDNAWKSMTWLGFVSAARSSSSFCLGSIKADTTGQ
jgi:Right handed beta helix region